MAELNEYLAKQQKKMIERQQGIGTLQGGVSSYGPTWEDNHANLPAYMNYRTLLQDPATGAFIPIVGIDGDPADPLGRS